MCIDISAESIVLQYFKYNDKPLTYNKLREIRRRILSQVDECSFVDVSLPSLLTVIDHYSPLFEWNENKVEMKEHSSAEVRRIAESAFDCNMDGVVKKAVRTAVSNEYD